MIDYKKELNEKQYEAVTYNEGPLLIVAGPGSGKTRTLTFKTAKLLEDGVSPDRILLLTFTNRAAKEMLNRITDMLGDKIAGITACTYHAFCVELLRKYIHLIGYENNFTILSSTDAEDAITIIKAEYPEQEEKDFPTSKNFLSLLSLSKNKQIPFEDIVMKDEKASYYKEVLLAIEDSYEQYKLDRNLLDYNDIITLTNLMLEANPSVRRTVSEQYEYKMVDEYQDTSPLQARFINNLCMYGNDKITVVGDDAQSIFSFSGAEPKNILEFPDKFKDCKTVILDENYRSTQCILDMANATMLSMRDKFEKHLHTSNSIGNKPCVTRVANPRSEAEYIFNRIYMLCDGDFDKLGTTAIISRRAFDTFNMESILTKNKIDYRKYGGIKFSEKVYVRDILAFLKLTVNPKDEIAWFRVLNLCEGVGSVTSKKVIPDIIANGSKELINKKYEKMKYANDFAEIYGKIEEYKKLTLQKALADLINKYYFNRKEKMIYKKKITTEKRNRELQQNDKEQEEACLLQSLASDYKKTEDFLSDLVLEQPDSKEKSNIVITTIHSAKGMEFDNVFYMNCIAMPQDSKDRDSEEEARRCFFVAITRAKKNLYITWPYYNGYNYRNNEESLFLLESPEIIKSYTANRLEKR